MKKGLVLAMLVAAALVTPAGWAQDKPAAKDAKAAPAAEKDGLEDLLPGADKTEGGNRADAEQALRGDLGDKAGDLKNFVIRTETDISTLQVGDLYKNEDTAYKIMTVKAQGKKGGKFTAQRIVGQNDPQRRWQLVSGAGPKVIITRVTLLDLYQQGGPFLHPIALLFVLLVVLTINGLLVYRRKAQCPAAFVTAAEAALCQGDLVQFEKVSREAKGLMPFICRHMIQDFQVDSMADIRNRVEVATVVQINRLRIPIRAMNLIAVAAPLLGLLGTIVGMVIVFEGVAGTSGAAKATVLAAGIRVKLFATASALMVAIPALFAYFICNQKLGSIIGECELIHERFMYLLAQLKRAGGQAENAEVADDRRHGTVEEE